MSVTSMMESRGKAPMSPGYEDPQSSELLAYLGVKNIPINLLNLLKNFFNINGGDPGGEAPWSSELLTFWEVQNQASVCLKTQK